MRPRAITACVVAVWRKQTMNVSTVPRSVAAVLTVAAMIGLPAGAHAQASAAGCAPSRPAIAYHAGGRPISPDQVLVPCATETGFYTGETGIGVTQQGTVWFSAANWEWQMARSDDDGAHWSAFTVPGPQAEPGCYMGTSALLPQQCDPSEQGKRNTVADSYLYVDPYTSKIFWSKTYGYAVCSSMNMSADDGASWYPVSRFACPGGDYEKIAAGPPPAGGAKPTGYPDVIYSCENGPAPWFVVGPARTCNKSLDGGVTWNPTGAPPVPSPLAPGCLHFQEPERVGPDGTLYQPLGCAPTGSNPVAAVQVAISHDEGQTWSYSAPPTGTTGNGAGLIGGVSLDVDEAGNVYVVWPGSDNHVYLDVSKDGGTTWAGPFDATMPGVSEGTPRAQVAADRNTPGHIAIAYYGYTGGDSKTLNGYLTESFDAADANPTFYTAELNDPSQPLYFPVKSGTTPNNDYLGVTIAPDGTPWTALVKLLSDTPDSQGYIQSTGFAARLISAGDLVGDRTAASRTSSGRARAATIRRRRYGRRPARAHKSRTARAGGA